MKNIWLFILIVAMVLGFGAGSIFTGSSNPTSNSPTETVSNDAPWPLLTGGNITLAEFKGNKPVILDFWASWCPNCQRDMPVLNGYYEKYKDQIEVIGVNLQENSDTILEFVTSNNITFPIVIDPRGQIANEFGISYTNTHVLIDIEGNVSKVIPGDIQESDILGLLENS